ncbi:amino acid/polyamine/organocation transporter (APC superfamily) [Pseudoduganella lurida]|uniref:Amino acid/polyamine/organocation transporter (APC superfamily) n=1 Tax=Pseudoduganella lurida TaxID=1036180 RepID=A0A562RG57_9BURK|nr:amino acid permease [Pseudoduganella lurida]TWI67406.1 amino acid/polyamine/organocation transporter (APC superfamily) [Pseudoduganella lurida]
MSEAAASTGSLRPSLGWGGLLVLGIANILGAGVYVMTGTAAARFAGPAVTVSFAIAGAACLLVALCYAELASSMPESGSAYSYCRRALGGGPAWSLGWLLFLEYSVAASLLAVGFAGYLGSMLADFGLHFPAALSTPLIHSVIVDGKHVLSLGAGFNLVAALAVLCAGGIAALGMSRYSLVNTLLVVVKVGVLVSFIVVGAGAVNPANWTPFVPPNEGGFVYGWEGVARGASLLFFAFLGFETVSTAAAETRKPQRDVPIGILGSLVVCTTLYVLSGFVLTGLVPFRELGVPDPIAIAVDRIGYPAIALVIKIGALAGLASVLLANAFGHSRICYAMARDGYLPPVFCAVHRTRNSLCYGNLLLAGIAAVSAALLPISVMSDLISFGVAFMFAMVAVSLIHMRNTHPDLERKFRVPFGGVTIRGMWIGYVPVAAIVTSFVMTLPVALDILDQARRGDWLAVGLLGAYALIGVSIYQFYGKPRARALLSSLNQKEPPKYAQSH